jgi:hypothetical protein
MKHENRYGQMGTPASVRGTVTGVRSTALVPTRLEQRCIGKLSDSNLSATFTDVSRRFLGPRKKVLGKCRLLPTKPFSVGSRDGSASRGRIARIGLPVGETDFYLCTTPRRTLGPNQPPILRVMRALVEQYKKFVV